MPSWTLRVLFGSRCLARPNTRNVDGTRAEHDQYQARHDARIESHTPTTDILEERVDPNRASDYIV
jgi:hypothetical protein